MSGRPGVRPALGRALPWVALVVGFAVVVAVAGRRPDEGNPLDRRRRGRWGPRGWWR